MPRPEQMAVSCSITLSVPVTQNTEQGGVGQGLPPQSGQGSCLLSVQDQMTSRWQPCDTPGGQKAQPVQEEQK